MKEKQEDFVRIQDYVKFLKECVIPSLEKEIIVNQEDFEKHKLEYENRFFSKLFKYKFENSESYRWYKMERSWGTTPRQRLKLINEELNRLDYLEKLEYSVIQMNLSYYPSFYKWCSENNIPY